MAGDNPIVMSLRLPTWLSYYYIWDLGELWLLKSQCFLIADIFNSQSFLAMDAGKYLLQTTSVSHLDP